MSQSRKFTFGRVAVGLATVLAPLAIPMVATAAPLGPTITAGANPSAAAINPRTNTLFVTNYSDNTVSVINGATNSVTATVLVGNHPAGVAVNPTTNGGKTIVVIIPSYGEPYLSAPLFEGLGD